MYEHLGLNWDISVLENVFKQYNKAIESGELLVTVEPNLYSGGMDVVLFDTEEVPWREDSEKSIEEFNRILEEDTLDHYYFVYDTIALCRPENKVENK